MVHIGAILTRQRVLAKCLSLPLAHAGVLDNQDVGMDDPCHVLKFMVGSLIFKEGTMTDQEHAQRHKRILLRLLPDVDIMHIALRQTYTLPLVCFFFVCLHVSLVLMNASREFPKRRRRQWHSERPFVNKGTSSFGLRRTDKECDNEENSKHHKHTYGPPCKLSHSPLPLLFYWKEGWGNFSLSEHIDVVACFGCHEPRKEKSLRSRISWTRCAGWPRGMSRETKKTKQLTLGWSTASGRHGGPSEAKVVRSGKRKTPSLATPKKLLKDDLLLVAQKRARQEGNEDAALSLKKHKATALRGSVGKITEGERVFLEEIREKRGALAHLDVSVLKKTLMAHGYGKGSKWSKTGMIDLIIDKKLDVATPIVFDADQKQLLTKVDDPLLLVAAGPGSGKTTSLAKFACQLSETNSSARILLVMFNVGAERNMIARIEMLDGQVKKARDLKASGPDAFNPWKPTPGITCLTFNKLAYRILSWTRPPTAAGGKSDIKDSRSTGVSSAAPDIGCHLDDQLPEAARILEEKPMKGAWDWIFIDEAQDITGKYVDFVQCLRQHAKHVVIAGDPRQEIYTGSRFYSDLWSTTPTGCKFVMRYNHRSRRNIIETLNVFSGAAFRSLHHDQLCPSAAGAECGGGDNDEDEEEDDDDDAKKRQTIVEAMTMAEDVDSSSSNSPAVPENKEEEVDPWSWVNEDTSPAATATQPISSAVASTESDAAAAENGVVKLLIFASDDVSLAIAHELMKYHPRHVFIMCPITVTKFGIGTILMGVKNALAQLGCLYPLQVLADDSKFTPTDNVYYAGSARKLKGTERGTVLVLGAHLPYTSYGIEESEYRKALYVCVSRAIHCLTLVLPENARIMEHSPLGAVVRCDKSAQFRFATTPSLLAATDRKMLMCARVKDDLAPMRGIECKSRPWSPPSSSPPTLPAALPGPVRRGPHGPPALDAETTATLKIRHNEDFMGLYIEARLAILLGAQNIDHWEQILRFPRQRIRHLTRQETRTADAYGRFVETHEDGSLTLLLRHNCSADVPEELLSCTDRAYALCVLTYTSQVGQWWVASRHVRLATQSVEKELTVFLRDLAVYLGLDISTTTEAACDHIKRSTRPVWGKPLRHAMMCERGPGKSVPAGHINGIADLEWGCGNGGDGDSAVTGSVFFLEIKFARHKEDHVRQTAIYGAMLGNKRGLLLNLQEGTVSQVEPASLVDVSRYARAQLALKNGRSNPMSKRRIRQDWIMSELKVDLSGAAMVALDVETDGFPPHAPVLEVGAMAWYFGTDNVESVFCQLSDDAEVLDYAAGTSMGRQHVCGLRRKDGAGDGSEKASSPQDRLRRQTREWYSRLTGRKIILVWGACGDVEASGACPAGEGAPPPTVIDVRRLYLHWLELNECGRKSNTTLGDATRHLFTERFAEPHRAFEDTLMTVAVFNAIVDFGGSL